MRTVIFSTFMTIFLSLQLTFLVDAKENDATEKLIKKYTINDDIIDFGYLIQPTYETLYNFPKSFSYCVDVRNNTGADAKPDFEIRPNSASNKHHANIEVTYGESILPAGEFRKFCFNLTPPKKKLKDGIYNSKIVVKLNESEVETIDIRYQVITASQGHIMKTSFNKLVGTWGTTAISLYDKEPLATLVFDINELSKRYIFDKNFTDIFGIDNRTTCKLEEKTRNLTCPPPPNALTKDCSESYYEISYQNNTAQCYLFFNKKRKLTKHETRLYSRLRVYNADEPLPETYYISELNGYPTAEEKRVIELFVE